MTDFFTLPYTAVYNPQKYTTRTPTFDPKILEKMDFVSIDLTQIQHSKGPCVSTPKKKPTLQTLFFTHDVFTSSNYAYLSLQTHQLFAFSAVIGNRFTIVKLQFKCHALCTCQKTSLQAREATQKYNFRGRKPCSK